MHFFRRTNAGVCFCSIIPFFSSTSLTTLLILRLLITLFSDRQMVTSRADWEHLSSRCGFSSLLVQGKMKNGTGELVENVLKASLALIVRSFSFNCKRDENDALKLEMDGAAVGGMVDKHGSDITVESISVDAYISSSTVKTYNRLKQLHSRLLRGLKSQVDRLMLADIRRDGSRHTLSMDSNSLAPTTAGLRRESSARSLQRAPSAALFIGQSDVEDGSTIGFQGDGEELASARRLFPCRFEVRGDHLVVTMHGFSFDANQPQAKLLFSAYDFKYGHRRYEPSDMDISQAGCLYPYDAARMDNLYRSLSLNYDLLDVQYSDQRQQSVTVMSLPNPCLILQLVEMPHIVVVDFTTSFQAAVRTSPSVSHYDYLRQLLSLYRSATIGTLASTFSAMDPGRDTLQESEAPGMPQEQGSSSSAAAAFSAVDNDGGELASGGTLSEPGSDRGSDSSNRLAHQRWGGRDVVFNKLEFAPLLMAELNLDVTRLLSWLGVGGVEALPAGLYDILMIPLSNTGQRFVDQMTGFRPFLDGDEIPNDLL